ncbi:MAG: hypothetical protein COA81_04855 [Alphaproteobacteria bacterium]|nr:MAG: hypothetical protein COA81_04855 [Alphaproteobacteria bacterium]
MRCRAAILLAADIGKFLHRNRADGGAAVKPRQKAGGIIAAAHPQVRRIADLHGNGTKRDGCGPGH